MENMVLYRKYRSKNFKEVVGQDHIVKVLESSIKSGKISHAYLFVGSRGTGKTSIARILAVELGISVNDLYEIDAASNRGIDDIRELREGIRTLPFDSKYKVYIIDEVHMLTKEAFNALLKTLEEPPAHAIFVLATTELHKVPETIVSRCQVFNFKKPSDVILKNFVIDISEKEKFSIDQESAELVALLGDGSFRDTLGVLQKVLGFAKDKKIVRENVEQITGAPASLLVRNFITSLAEGSVESGIKAIRKANEDNLDMKFFAKLIIYKMRGLVFLKYAPSTKKELMEEFSESDILFFEEMVKKNKNIFDSKAISVMLEAYQNIDKAFITGLPLELALMKILSKN